MTRKFIQARHFTKTNPNNPRKVDLIVLHSMESGDSEKAALNVALWFGGPSAPNASAHYCVSSVEVVQCVKEEDVAWGAPGTNHNGIQIEQTGWARMTKDKWLAPPYCYCLRNAAKLIRECADRWLIPIEYVDAEGLLRGDRGVTVHSEVTKACQFAKLRKLSQSPFFKATTTHTDPGKGYPLEAVLASAKGDLELVMD